MLILVLLTLDSFECLVAFRLAYRPAASAASCSATDLIKNLDISSAMTYRVPALSDAASPSPPGQPNEKGPPIPAGLELNKLVRSYGLTIRKNPGAPVMGAVVDGPDKPEAIVVQTGDISDGDLQRVNWLRSTPGDCRRATAIVGDGVNRDRPQPNWVREVRSANTSARCATGWPKARRKKRSKRWRKPKRQCERLWNIRFPS